MVIARSAAARRFYEGLAAVVLDGDWGFSDTSGAVRIAPSYSAVDDFSAA
jgi:WG containing repeat